MSRWPRWDRTGAPGALNQYVQYGVVAGQVPRDRAGRLPGPSDEPQWHRARRIYQVFTGCDIGYVHEPTASEPGRQGLRPPDEVLRLPGEGTCLDLAVAFSGACLDAGLHPMIVVLDPAGGGDGHALVVVWLRGDWARAPGERYPWRDQVHHHPPPGLVDQLRSGTDQPGRFVAIDVTGATRRRDGSSPIGWDAAVAGGTRMLTAAAAGEGRWRWGVGVDVGVGWRHEDALAMPHVPASSPLSRPYRDPDPDAGPLLQLRARRGLVPFYGRDELDVLLDWCQAPDDTSRTRVAVVHGVGGAGKTHLAAELAHRLGTDGWYTGFLRRSPDPADLGWLAGLPKPLLVVLDYAEDARAATAISLLTALAARTEPACVILTARAVGGWWAEIASTVENDDHPYLPFPPLELPRRHPSVTGVFQRALRAFAQLPGMTLVDIDNPPHNPRWTTLDLVMLAWLAAHGAATLPTTPQLLYDEILSREFGYWTRVCERRELGPPPRRLLSAVGACVTLLAPRPHRVAEVLASVPALEREDMWRAQIAEVVEDLLPPDADTGTVAIRPDPVGERLLIRELESESELLGRCLGAANDDELANVCLAISRAAERDEVAAARLATSALSLMPRMWRPALDTVAAQGGPLTAPLLALADRDDSPLPLRELADTIPPGHVTLRTLALVATLRTQPADPTDPTDHDAVSRLAGWWNNLSVRQSDTGDRTGALASSTEAVEHYRRLAEASPAAYLPNLAMSLNNLSVQQSATGDRDGALTSITEAVQIRRRLAEASPAAYLPDLAMSLTNLAHQQADAGEERLALEAFDAAWSDLTPGARAELMLARARWRAGRDDQVGAVADRAEAAYQAAQESDPRWAGRSRRTVRDALRTTGDDDHSTSGLPKWAWRPLPEEMVALIDRWLGAAGWAERESLLREHVDLASAPRRDELRLAREIYPEVEPLAQLVRVVDEIVARGHDQVLAEYRREHEHADLLHEWLATPTWTDSRNLLRRHPDLASDPRTAAVLEQATEDPMLAQHLGIVGLVARMPVNEVYDMVMDVGMAVDAAMTCVENGDMATLADLRLATPQLGELPFVAPFLAAVRAVLTADHRDVLDVAEEATEQGTDTQRAAAAARLRRLARREPRARHRCACSHRDPHQARPGRARVRRWHLIDDDRLVASRIRVG